MMKNVLIKIRSAPKRPERKKVKIEYILYDGDTLDSVINYFLTKGCDITNVYVDCYSDEYYNISNLRFISTRDETDEEYNQRINKYQNELEKYNRWYNDNRELIERELTRRREEEQRKLVRKTEREKRKLLKDKKMLEKQLSKIEEQILEE